jgi:hypothetical protein
VSLGFGSFVVAGMLYHKHQGPTTFLWFSQSSATANLSKMKKRLSVAFHFVDYVFLI